MVPPPGEVPAVDDDVQCGYYAIERFRATWQITHVSGIFLTGEFDGQSGRRQRSCLIANFLNLLWYGPQGCIQSSSYSNYHSLFSSCNSNNDAVFGLDGQIPRYLKNIA